MQHKNNRTTPDSISQLSTRIQGEELEILKRKLPTDWVDRVLLKCDYSAATIRTVLRDGKANHEAMMHIVEVAEAYQVEVETGVKSLKDRIKNLTTV